MEPEARHRVSRLVALLRVADGLDREHRQSVRAVRARRRKSQVVIEVDSDGDILLERVRLRRRGQFFSTVFDVGLKIRTATAAP